VGPVPVAPVPVVPVQVALAQVALVQGAPVLLLARVRAPPAVALQPDQRRPRPEQAVRRLPPEAVRTGAVLRAAWALESRSAGFFAA